MTPPQAARGERLAAIRARCEAATAGPWYLVPLPWRRRDAPSYVVTKSEDPHAGRPVLMPWECEEFCDDFTEDDWIGQADADLEFAAHAREDIPWLLDQLAPTPEAAPADAPEVERVVTRSLEWRDHRAAHIETCGPCRMEAKLAADYGFGPEHLEHCYTVRARDDAATLAAELARLRADLPGLKVQPRATPGGPAEGGGG